MGLRDTLRLPAAFCCTCFRKDTPKTIGEGPGEGGTTPKPPAGTSTRPACLSLRGTE
jgi:hypothetical protein